VEVGTSKITGRQGSHIKPIGCGASGAYTPGSDDEEEEEEAVLQLFSIMIIGDLLYEYSQRLTSLYADL
jgi:hypothetical protein